MNPNLFTWPIVDILTTLKWPCFVPGTDQYYINWRYVQIQNVVNNVDMSSLRAPWQNGPYKKQLKEQHKTLRTPRHNRYLEKNISFFGKGNIAKSCLT